VQAYFDCRRRKLGTYSALFFEQEREPNLIELFDELHAGAWQPGKSICFVVDRPKIREVWAASFRDRIVHHLLYNRIRARFENAFIADTCACIGGRGTLYAAHRLAAKIRSITENWSRRAFYLKMDVANFFVSIDKRILRELLAAKIAEPWWWSLTERVLMHDPRENFEVRGNAALMNRVPPHKRLAEQPAHRGLPIGNLSSQFFANVYLDVLDQHAKHRLRARRYVRYVDDFVFLADTPEQIGEWKRDVEQFLPSRLALRVNPSKTIIQPIERGVDFVGQIVLPWHSVTRRRTVNEGLRRVAAAASTDVYARANSYFGLLRQASASHHDRAELANVVRSRGRAIDANFTKTYRGDR
jgi:RNA-directed DNA polymerase